MSELTQSRELTQSKAQELIYREGRMLDEQRWEEWLDLFTEDTIYWVPAWKSENETTSSPDTELSLIYYEGRKGILDRVWRLRSGLSPASNPLRRTAHMTSNVMVDGETPEGLVVVVATFAVYQFDPKRRSDHVFFGRYEYQFKFLGGAWLIARKKTILANDQIPAVADFYLL